MTGYMDNENIKKNSPYVKFIGQYGQYGVGNISSMGILKEINFKEGYLLIQPSLIGVGPDLRIEESFPTIISLNSAGPLFMRPLKKVDLENIIKESKESFKQRKLEKINKL